MNDTAREMDYFMKPEEKNTLSLNNMMLHLSTDQQARLSDRVFLYDTLESTSITAREMFLSGSTHGAVIIADSQTAGKGRQGKSFYSPPNHGLYMSFILSPEQLGFSTPTLITAFAAVSVCEAIEAISNKTPQIKWVNDVFIDGKKTCGILTESVTPVESRGSQGIILGIGVNFSTPASQFPEKLQNIAGSVFETGKPAITRNQLAAEIIKRIISPEFFYSEKKLLEKYRQRMFLLGKTVIVSGAEQPYEAEAVDIDEKGQLIVRTGSGELVSLCTGEISIRGS